MDQTSPSTNRGRMNSTGSLAPLPNFSPQLAQPDAQMPSTIAEMAENARHVDLGSPAVPYIQLVTVPAGSAVEVDGAMPALEPDDDSFGSDYLEAEESLISPKCSDKVPKSSSSD